MLRTILWLLPCVHAIPTDGGTGHPWMLGALDAAAGRDAHLMRRERRSQVLDGAPTELQFNVQAQLESHSGRSRANRRGRTSETLAAAAGEPPGGGNRSFDSTAGPVALAFFQRETKPADEKLPDKAADSEKKDPKGEAAKPEKADGAKAEKEDAANGTKEEGDKGESPGKEKRKGVQQACDDPDGMCCSKGNTTCQNQMKELRVCPANCAMGCCCFYRWFFRRSKETLQWMKSMTISGITLFQATQTGMYEDAAASSKETASKNPLKDLVVKKPEAVDKDVEKVAGADKEADKPQEAEKAPDTNKDAAKSREAVKDAEKPQEAVKDAEKPQEAVKHGALYESYLADVGTPGKHGRVHGKDDTWPEKNDTAQKKRSDQAAKEAALYASDVFADVMKWGFGLPSTILFLCVLHEFIFARIKPPEKFENEDAITRKISPEELDRLGGVETAVKVKVVGISRGKWLLTQFVGLGLFYVVMTNPELVSYCLLGKSGRLLVLVRKPTTTTPRAALMCRGMGATILGFTLGALVVFRSLERALILYSQKGSHEALSLHTAAIGSLVQGHVQSFTFAVFALQYVGALIILKRAIRPWAFSDERNYYDAKEACVGQYYRTGSRGILPGICKPRRRGGMRIFFGPYPRTNEWRNLGQGVRALRSLEPMMVMPTDMDNGHPPSGPGEVSAPEKDETFMQLVLARISVVLGAIGLLIFIVHMHNLMSNVNNCPTRQQIFPCVKNGDCTRLSRTSWFQGYLVTNDFLSSEEVVEQTQSPMVPISKVATWLQAKDIEDAEQLVLDIANESCLERVDELVDSPEKSIVSPAADAIGKFHARNYLQAYKDNKYNVTWDGEKMTCRDCVASTRLMYFTNAENVIEIIEIAMLTVTVYVSSLIYRLAMRKLENYPMVDLMFANDPGSQKDLDVLETEKRCMQVLAKTFFMRYSFLGVPKVVKKAEEDNKMSRHHGGGRKSGSDSWELNHEAKDWNAYKLSPPHDARHILVNRALLGIIEDEEVLAAWNESPRFTSAQLVTIFTGVIFFFVMPLLWAFLMRKPLCFLDPVVASILFYAGVWYFVLQRRPTSAFVLTTRRVFQISILPAFRDLFGMTEPMIKLDVMIHNHSVWLSQMNMETYIPLWRRIASALLGFPIFRRGTIVCNCSHGIFKLWRERGDANVTFEYFSRLVDMPNGDILPSFGSEMMEQERKLHEDQIPDPCCSFSCCPHTPLPPMTKEGLLERYCMRLKTEKDIYSRKLAIRPASCMDLFFGRGCRCACECCCCCELDECVSELVVTTNRVLIEQRGVQRYCRPCTLWRPTPNLRVTYLALNKASAYLTLTPSQPWGFRALRRDLCIKLLQTGAFEYVGGLMLQQKPYMICYGKEDINKNKIWMEHICRIYDRITQKTEYADGDESEEAGDDDDEDEEDDALTAAPAKEDSASGSGSEAGSAREAATKGKGHRKGHDGERKGAGKGGKRGKGKGKHHTPPEQGLASASAVGEEQGA